jgi:CheY-like chemotaxis protein
MLSIAFLQMGETDPQKLEILETIETSARHGADMVKQVLTFARGTDGERISLQIRDIVNDVVKLSRETFPRNIEIRASLPSDLWRVNGDPSQLHRVLLNLVVNARDAMPQGGKIRIAAANRIIEAPDLARNPDATLGPAVMLEIEDTGAGMTAEVLAKIFDPFFTTKERGRGTGLGLSTSLSIVKSHGGFVRADSEPGRGSRFSICLPAEGSAKPAVVAEKTADLPRGQGQLVLLVDDEPNVLSVTGGTLKAFGYRVITAVDGADAVGVFASHKDEVAVVLTDMMMPVMDGLATARVLRRMRPHVPIILSSGLGGEGRMGQATEAGIRDFLHKPYTADTLLKSLAEVLRPYDPDEDSDDDD